MSYRLKMLGYSCQPSVGSLLWAIHRAHTAQNSMPLPRAFPPSPVPISAFHQLVFTCPESRKLLLWAGFVKRHGCSLHRFLRYLAHGCSLMSSDTWLLPDVFWQTHSWFLEPTLVDIMEEQAIPYGQTSTQALEPRGLYSMWHAVTCSREEVNLKTPPFHFFSSWASVSC